MTHMPETKPAKCGKRSGKPKTLSGTTRLETLREIQESNVQKYNKVKNTDSAYTGYLKRAREFLNAQVEDRVKRGVTLCEAGIVTADLAKAFDMPPNKYSAMAIEMYMSHKCFEEGRGKRTAEGIHAAFCRYWDEM